MPTTLNRTVPAGNSDADEIGDDTGFSGTGTTVACNGDTGGPAFRKNAGFRFTNIPVPNGANGGRIKSAVFSANVIAAGFDLISADIHFEAIDDALTFVTNADVNGRARTTASVLWQVAGLGEGMRSSPDLSVPLQEVIDRAGWAGTSSSDVCVLLIGRNDVAAQVCVFEAFENAGTSPATLDIVYVAGAIQETQPVETDTPNVGTPKVTVAGSLATSTITALAGSPIIRVAGSQATTTGTPNVGTPNITGTGDLTAETDTANGGTSAITVAGGLGTSTDTGLAGSPTITTAGGLATETSTAQTGTPTITVAGTLAVETDTAFGETAAGGTLATETDTANVGTPRIVQPGSLAAETDTANAGTSLVASAGGQATTTDTAPAGTPLILVAGSLATETDLARGPSGTLIPGSLATETTTALAGTPLITVAGGLVVETDSPFAGTAPVFAGRPTQATITMSGGWAATVELDPEPAVTVTLSIAPLVEVNA